MFETLCWGGNLSLCGQIRGWGQLKLQIGVLHPQYLQKFDERPENRSIMSPPSHNSHGQWAALEPPQNKTCL